jgi:hypothetical protein
MVTINGKQAELTESGTFKLTLEWLDPKIQQVMIQYVHTDGSVTEDRVRVSP